MINSDQQTSAFHIVFIIKMLVFIINTCIIGSIGGNSLPTSIQPFNFIKILSPKGDTPCVPTCSNKS